MVQGDAGPQRTHFTQVHDAVPFHSTRAAQQAAVIECLCPPMTAAALKELLVRCYSVTIATIASGLLQYCIRAAAASLAVVSTGTSPSCLEQPTC
jgi:hypothetical protein